MHPLKAIPAIGVRPSLDPTPARRDVDGRSGVNSDNLAASGPPLLAPSPAGRGGQSAPLYGFDSRFVFFLACNVMWKINFPLSHFGQAHSVTTSS
jgi:hypothetical protein